MAIGRRKGIDPMPQTIDTTAARNEGVWAFGIDGSTKENGELSMRGCLHGNVQMGIANCVGWRKQIKPVAQVVNGVVGLH
jgi:hypothetical protein